jgi:hypothetical protein
MSYKLNVELVGHVTPRAPFRDQLGIGAHGVTRPTLET